MTASSRADENFLAQRASDRFAATPKLSHEALVQVIRDAPTLIARFVCPEDQSMIRSVRVTSAEFVDLNLPEYYARDRRVRPRCRRVGPAGRSTSATAACSPRG